MHTDCKLTFGAALLLAMIAFSAASADDHVVIELTRSGMGMRYPARITEIWLSETSVSINMGRFIAIARYDLGKRWTLSPQTKRYFEGPLTPPAEEKRSKDSVTIQRIGWNYEPVYDWIVRETQREELVGDQRCKLIVADGDADYSSETIELWVADQVPIDIARLNERVASKMVDFDWQALVQTFPALNKFLIMRSVDKTEHPIAPEMTAESKVTKIEVATPPPKTYEIPDGFQKVNSIEELTK